jgi:predicted DNA-binding transcriptional regulator YafY
MTAKAMAEQFGVSVRTVQRIFAQPRADYLANSLSRSKPWEGLGMSRATWYRLGKPERPIKELKTATHSQLAEE